jgi:glycosyltransferase involved in cell wall biosynthesis
VGHRIVMHTRVHPGDRGGVQAVFNGLAGYLRRQGHVVTKSWGYAGAAVPPADRACVLPPLVWRGGLPAPRSSVEVSLAAARCGAQLLGDRPDVVNVHYVTESALYYLRLRRLFGFAVVLSVHGSDVLRPEAGYEGAVARALAEADAITAVSQVTAARAAALARVPSERIRVIPNGIDYGYWSEPVAPITRAEPSHVVLSVGRLDPVKGHDVLLHAFARVLPDVPPARLVIVGAGGFRGTLERLASALGIAARVTFAGELPAADVRAQMAGARVFVLPSRSEGLPLAPLEAMAAGLPVVATRVGGVPEAIAPGSGVLVPAEDPAALAGALREVLVHRGLGDDLAARGRVQARRFDVAVAHAAYDEVLAAAVASARGRRAAA